MIDIIDTGNSCSRSNYANPGLNFNPGFFSSNNFLYFFSEHTITYNHQIVFNKNYTACAFKLLYPSLNFALTLGYLNLALNNPALKDNRVLPINLLITMCKIPCNVCFRLQC